MLTFFLALQLGANRWSAAGATLIIGSTPAVAHATATITSDAPGLLVGAALCLVAVYFVRGRIRWWWLVPAAAATTAVKATGLLVVGLVVVFLLLHLARPSRLPTVTDPTEHDDSDEVDGGDERLDDAAPLSRGTLWLAIIAVAAPAVAVLGAWTVVNRLTDLPAVNDPLLRGFFHVDSIGWTALVSNLVQLMSPVQQGYLPPVLVNPTLGNLMALVNLLLVAGVAVLAWSGARRAVQTRLAAATLAAMLLGGMGFVLLIFVGSHTYITIPSRYGLSILPAVAAVLAVVASRRRLGGYALTGLGAATLVALLAQTL